MIRTFLALVPPPQQQKQIAHCAEALEPLLPGVRWVRPENLHFTLRYFGGLEQGDRATAAHVVSRVAAQTVSFPLELGALGVFPRWAQPRVLWWGVARGKDRLGILAKVSDLGFEDAGLGRADKAFTAHLTFGRWKKPAPVSQEVQSGLSGNLPQVLFPASSLCLMGSTLGSEGPRYDVLHESFFKKTD